MVLVDQMVPESKTNGVYSSINKNQINKINHDNIISNSNRPFNRALDYNYTLTGIWNPRPTKGLSWLLKISNF